MLRTVSTFIVLLAAIPAIALAEASHSDQVSRTIPIADGASFTIDNPTGTVVITGSDQKDLNIVAIRTVRGVDDAAVEEGRKQSQIAFGGDEKTRGVKTIGNYVGQGRWIATFVYTIRIPRSVAVNVFNMTGDVRVADLHSNVYVKTLNGRINILDIDGVVTVDTINGNINASYMHAPGASARLTTVNGEIELQMPANARFNWVCETLRGEILSSIPVKAVSQNIGQGKKFTATSNGAGGPTIETSSTMGKIYLVSRGKPRTMARVVSPGAGQNQNARVTSTPIRPDIAPVLQRTMSSLLIQKPNARYFVRQEVRYNGNLQVDSSFGNIFIGEVAGDAQISTRAGEVILGRVLGRCTIESLGGPVNLGDIMGPIDASTSAGDIAIHSAAKGGSASTDGGNIQVFYAGGPMTLTSGGGDITLRHATASLHAETRSGDIVVGYDPQVRSQRMDLKTVGGNILVSVSPTFAADIDATIIMPADATYAIDSDLSGLTTTRQRINANQVRVRATGKVNGGGERVVLYTEGGNIQLRNRPLVQR